jgi:hypothetical protein
LRTWPASANSRVPVERPAPSAAKAAPPLLMIHGMFAIVSTLLTTVGSP